MPQQPPQRPHSPPPSAIPTHSTSPRPSPRPLPPLHPQQTSSPPPNSSGSLSLQSLRLDKQIGRGSFSTVYKAHLHNRTVAVKSIRLHRLSRKLLNNLTSEIDILTGMAKARHKHVVNLIGWERTENHLNLVLEWCTWGDLSALLRARGKIVIRIPGVWWGSGGAVAGTSSHAHATNTTTATTTAAAMAAGAQEGTGSVLRGASPGTLFPLKSQPSNSSLKGGTSASTAAATATKSSEKSYLDLAGPWGGLDQTVIKYFLGQLASALSFLQRNKLLHRDLKPQNLLLHPPPALIQKAHEYFKTVKARQQQQSPIQASGGSPAMGPMGLMDSFPHSCSSITSSDYSTSPTSIHGVPLDFFPILKLADFGFAKSLSTPDSMTDTLCGSPLYMAPEILRYERYSAKADLWSVGIILYECLFGRTPFRAQNHIELLRRIEQGRDRIPWRGEGVDDGLRGLVQALLKQQPEERIGFDDFFEAGVVVEGGNLRRRMDQALEDAEEDASGSSSATTNDERERRESREGRDGRCMLAGAMSKPIPIEGRPRQEPRDQITNLPPRTHEYHPQIFEDRVVRLRTSSENCGVAEGRYVQGRLADPPMRSGGITDAAEGLFQQHSGLSVPPLNPRTAAEVEAAESSLTNLTFPFSTSAPVSVEHTRPYHVQEEAQHRPRDGHQQWTQSVSQERRTSWRPSPGGRQHSAPSWANPFQRQQQHTRQNSALPVPAVSPSAVLSASARDAFEKDYVLVEKWDMASSPHLNAMASPGTPQREPLNMGPATSGGVASHRYSVSLPSSARRTSQGSVFSSVFWAPASVGPAGVDRSRRATSTISRVIGALMNPFGDKRSPSPALSGDGAPFRPAASPRLAAALASGSVPPNTQSSQGVGMSHSPSSLSSLAARLPSSSPLVTSPSYHPEPTVPDSQLQSITSLVTSVQKRASAVSAVPAPRTEMKLIMEAFDSIIDFLRERTGIRNSGPRVKSEGKRRLDVVSVVGGELMGRVDGDLRSVLMPAFHQLLGRAKKILPQTEGQGSDSDYTHIVEEAKESRAIFEKGMELKDAGDLAAALLLLEALAGTMDDEDEEVMMPPAPSAPSMLDPDDHEEEQSDQDVTRVSDAAVNRMTLLRQISEVSNLMADLELSKQE